MQLHEVYDLLASYTAAYTRLLPTNYWPSPEFMHITDIIERLQKEIQTRTNKVAMEPQESVEPPTPWNESSHQLF